ncbi:rhodanese-like domain-containing protein [Salinibacterium sp. SYSU T00001]|uniref:rhodanese-like domain-containing protein n=1 Tax=Homoserinimonas sedimenticola TaxID=2986805 RepID=UPI0022361770|nr:rhodanese-like domain-containing protein [Salinibacterium sedimenticola]MCW4385714.1 rhodanese-like domain-containing protein [Salinibacterium sedimenticola]
MRELSVTDVAALDSPVILDVRELDEYRAVRAPGVLHIPMGEIMERVDEIPVDETVYVICAVGGRSARVAQYLESRGIDAVNVEGGTIAWQQAGLPVERG